MSSFSKKDIEAVHEAQQAVNLAASSVANLTSSDSLLLGELGLELLANLNEIERRLKGAASLADGEVSAVGAKPKR